jgi:hypothetical protein
MTMPRQRRAAGSDASRVVDAVFGKPLVRSDSKRATDDLSRRLVAETKSLYSERRRQAAAVAPLIEALGAAHEAEVAKARRARDKLVGGRRRPLPRPAVPAIEPGTFSGSIVAIAAPPYDWGSAHTSPKNAAASGNASLGDLSFNYQSISGHGDPTWGDAELGKWFSPSSSGPVRFRTTVLYSFSWTDSAFFYTAHSHAFVGAYIYEFSKQGLKLLADNRVQLWSDGAGWLDTHSDNQWGVSQQFDLPFLASNQSSYFLGVWCGFGADSDGGFLGFSYANGDFTGRVPVIVVKT